MRCSICLMSHDLCRCGAVLVADVELHLELPFVHGDLAPCPNLTTATAS